jgi:L,D-transpeptidase YcbB
MDLKAAVEKFFDNESNRKKVLIGAGVSLAVLVLAIILYTVRTPRVPREVFIDTVAVPMAERVKSLKLDASYYNKKIQHKTLHFYRKTKFQAKWLDYRKPRANYLTYVQSIKDGEKYGLNPNHYDLQEIEKSIVELYNNDERTPEEVANLDIRITGSFFLFTTHLIEGRIRTAGYGDFIWKKNVPKENDIQLLAENSTDDLSSVIEQLHSPHEQYEKLMKALQEYRKLEQGMAFQKVASGNATLKPGDSHPVVPSIRKRLFITDIDNYEPEDSLLYDEKLAEGVRRFQERHGLIADGVIRETTSRYLNQPFRHKADLIELNLERIRWLPTNYGDDYISINVPEYMLRVFEKGKKQLEMRVVLGSEFNATPIFSDSIEYIVFSPTWNVPKSIMGEEMIPELQANPTAFDPERFVFYQDGKEVHPEDIDWTDEELDTGKIQIVERPGETNSLGLMKFIMPNNYNVYLHDTPAEKLFKKNKRAYSHGCVRLERPMDFAKYLLRDNKKWDEERILESMQKEEPVTVILKKKYHVEIEYRTVWVDDDGKVQFRDDIYGHDKRQLALLKRLEERHD